MSETLIGMQMHIIKLLLLNRVTASDIIRVQTDPTFAQTLTDKVEIIQHIRDCVAIDGKDFNEERMKLLLAQHCDELEKMPLD